MGEIGGRVGNTFAMFLVYQVSISYGNFLPPVGLYACLPINIKFVLKKKYFFTLYFFHC